MSNEQTREADRDDSKKARKNEPLDLKELKICKQHTDQTISRIEQNDPALAGLHIGYPTTSFGGLGIYLSFNKAEIAKLGKYLGNDMVGNTLSIDGTFGINRPTNGMASVACNTEFFNGLRQNCSINSLTLFRCDLSEDTPQKMLNIFADNDTLTKCSLNKCGGLESGGGGRALSLNLKLCHKLEEISIKDCAISINVLKNLISAIRGIARLQKLEMSEISEIASIDFCEQLATLLQDPGSSLVTLTLSRRNIDSDCAIVIAKALKNNRKLKTLHLPIGSGLTDVGRDAFSNLLSDKSSVKNTYFSNHTLMSLGRQISHSENIAALLALNKSNDKQRVAVKKIFLAHQVFDMKLLFEWDMKMLPYVVSWFDAAPRACPSLYEVRCVDTRKLCAIHQFIHAMPENLERPRPDI